MSENTYLNWVSENTKTKWWHDSAEANELQLGIQRGCVGVTTNPFLANVALAKDRQIWSPAIEAVLAQKLAPEVKAEALMQIVVTRTAETMMSRFEASKGEEGLVCGQVNPLRAGDRDCMIAMARRYNKWAPNLAIKLPATSAGIDVLEDCVAEGINIACTVSFTVPQALAIAERHRAGAARAKANGIKPGKCYAVLMIGRLDDFLREMAHDNQAAVSESDIRQSGIAVAKRSYQIYQERGYEAVLLVAALRGDYHLTEIAGADVLMSIAPAFQDVFVKQDFAREERIDIPVAADVIERLSTMPDFVKAYEPDGMKPAEFMSFGSTQRTLSQFCEVGWKPMESYR
jgi:transaldolase